MPRKKYELCDTVFDSGNGSSQTQVLKYVGNRKILATTGETMWSIGRNNLPTLNLTYKPYIGKEIAEINLHPFDDYLSLLNPIKLFGAAVTWASNRFAGHQFSEASVTTNESVKYHTVNYSEASIGQETKSHEDKMQCLEKENNKSAHVILMGESKGTAHTFIAFAKNKYPNVKLVVLFGAIDSVEKVLPARILNIFKYESISTFVTNLIRYGLTLFTKYDPDGPSPLKSVADFPKDIPVVFVTSLADKVVPCANTENIAYALANKGCNDVYLLKLKTSSHSAYGYTVEDHARLETFIHAIYKKYQLKHERHLANKGMNLLAECRLKPEVKQDRLIP